MGLNAQQKKALATQQDDDMGDDEHEHHEPDGDEGPDAEFSDHDGDEENPDAGEDKPTDQEIADHIADGIDKGMVTPKIEALMAAHDPESGVPEWVADEPIWNRALNAVQPNGDGKDEYDDPWLVVGGLYRMLGGELKPNTEIPEMDEGAPDDDGEDGDED